MMTIRIKQQHGSSVWTGCCLLVILRRIRPAIANLAQHSLTNIHVHADIANVLNAELHDLYAEDNAAELEERISRLIVDLAKRPDLDTHALAPVAASLAAVIQHSYHAHMTEMNALRVSAALVLTSLVKRPELPPESYGAIADSLLLIMENTNDLPPMARAHSVVALSNLAKRNNMTPNSCEFVITTFQEVLNSDHLNDPQRDVLERALLVFAERYNFNATVRPQLLNALAAIRIIRAENNARIGRIEQRLA